MAHLGLAHFDTASLITSTDAQISKEPLYFKDVTKGRTCFKSITKGLVSYPNSFSGNALENFRCAIQSRYERKAPRGNTLYVDRVYTLEFRLFCILTPLFSPTVITSLPEHIWLVLINCLSIRFQDEPLPSEEFVKACGKSDVSGTVFFRLEDCRAKLRVELNAEQNQIPYRTRFQEAKTRINLKYKKELEDLNRQIEERRKEELEEAERIVKAEFSQLFTQSSQADQRPTDLLPANPLPTTLPPVNPPTANHPTTNPTQSSNNPKSSPPHHELHPNNNQSTLAGEKELRGLKRLWTGEPSTGDICRSHSMLRATPPANPTPNDIPLNSIELSARGSEDYLPPKTYHNIQVESVAQHKIWNNWRKAMRLGEIPLEEPQLKPTKKRRIPKDTPATFTIFAPPLKIFSLALRKIIKEEQYRCIGPKGSAMPAILAPNNCGMRVTMARQLPSLLVEWLRDQGEIIRDLRGYLLDGEKLSDFLDSWLSTSELDNQETVAFEGILGESDEIVFIQRQYADITFIFDDTCFDLIGQIIVNECKLLRNCS